MAIQLSVDVRDARLDAIEAVVGPDARLTIRTGAPPANCAAPDSGAALATLTLPSDWMFAASGGSKAKRETWQQPSAEAAGLAGHFRLSDATGTVCHLQGTVSATGGGGDLELDSTTLSLGDLVTITAFTLTDGNS